MEKTFCRISNWVWPKQLWSGLPSYNGSWIPAHHQNMSESGDIFGITVECIIYGGTKLTELVLQTVNASFEHCHVSDILKVGALTPIFKNKGDILNSKNYRGITITPTI